MATDDDDILAAPVPGPEAEASSSERMRAKTFGELVDKTLAGRTPPAMSADDRALLETATVIRAARGKAELSPERRQAAIEGALRQAVGGRGAGASGSIVPLARARAKRWAPWVVAATTTMVAAAAVLLWLRAPERVREVATDVPASWRSRPADPLIGAIKRESSGDASTRIDTIFADRLDGYRERRLRGGKP
jgi:hypothetical protein